MRSLPLIALSLAVLCLGSGSSFAQKSSIPDPDRFDVKMVDSAVSPCVNFFKYSCQKWMTANPIPSDQPAWSHGAKLALWNQSVLHEVLDQAAVGGAKRSAVEQKIGDYYGSCMDEKALNAKGFGPLKPELARIDGLKDKKQLALEIARQHENTFALAPSGDSGSATALFGFASSQDLDDSSLVVAAADQGGLGLPDRDYYLKTDAKSVETRKQYVEHVQKMFELIGDGPAQASSNAKVVMDMETELAKASMDIVKRRDPANLNHKLSAAELRALTPAFSWDDYLKAVGAPVPAHYLVATPDFFKRVNGLIESESLDHWKTYLRWHAVHNSASLLSEPFVQETFDFYGRKLVGQKELRPRWRRCVSGVDRDLGEALGQAYVDRTFGEDGKQRMLAMVHNLKDALGRDIEQLDWMTPETKKQALVKLKGIEDKIGYPNQWRDYSSVSIMRGDTLGNAYRSGDFEFRRQLAKIGKPVDRVEWGMTPPTVNAYYDPQLNTINFPAGILQPPFFDKKANDAANYGAIGSIIGHEMTHGFDDEGRKFDASGNLRDWWTEKDGKEFEVRAKCVADEYSSFDAVEGTKLNGELTLGENTADNGGARVALMALQSVLAKEGKAGEKEDGFSPEQEFFIAYGQTWCANYTPQLLRLQALSNPHSTPEWRVNGVVRNMPEFQSAFGCKKGEPMVPENACHVW